MPTENKPFVEVRTPGQYGTTTREPTIRELEFALKAKLQIEDARRAVQSANEHLQGAVAQCPHTLSVDRKGFPIDTRFCYACGQHQGFI